jgi:hypothetical protein
MQNIITTLAGLSYRPAEAKQAVDELEIGDPITLERDPGNEYDFNAVQIIVDEVFIGFIPKADNSEIASHLDAGKPYTAYVAGWAGTRKPTFSITLLEEGETE